MNRRNFFGSLVGLGAVAITGSPKASEKLEKMIEIDENEQLIVRNDGGISFRAQDSHVNVIPYKNEVFHMKADGSVTLGLVTPKPVLHVGFKET